MAEGKSTLGRDINMPGFRKEDDEPGILSKGFDAVSEALKRMAGKSRRPEAAEPAPSPVPRPKRTWED